jgi:hypothetical protein
MIITAKNRRTIDAMIGCMADSGAGYVVPLLKVCRAGRLAILFAGRKGPQSSVVRVRKQISKSNVVMLVGGERGPAAVPDIEKLLPLFAAVLVHAAPDSDAYLDAVNAARELGTYAIVDTEHEHVEAWTEVLVRLGVKHRVA